MTSTYRRKIAEYEADLYRIPKSWWERLFLPKKGGEMEIKHYQDGEKRLEIDLHGLKVPDGARVSALIDGKVVREVELRRGYVRLRLSSAEGESIPEVSNGSAAEIQYLGEILLQGTFRFD
jgi:hypothetical protein